MGLKWDDLVWMKHRMEVPLIVKGIATAEDARLSVEHGADVVYVSNHGGRQLDHGQGTIEVLPEVVEAVDGRAEILWTAACCAAPTSSRRCAWGRSAVGVGKMLGWALAAGGEAGLKRMLELMEVEIRTAMGLMGVTSLSQLNPSWVRPAQPVRPASETNALSVVRGAAQTKDEGGRMKDEGCRNSKRRQTRKSRITDHGSRP